MLRVTELAGFAGAFLAGAAYVPQIRHLVAERCSAGISRAAFNVWLAAAVLVMVRAVAIHANVFIVLGVIQVLATAVICLYAKLYEGLRCASHARADSVFELPPRSKESVLTEVVSTRGTVDGRVAHSMSDDELVDEMSIESFPASDPPSFWAGPIARGGLRPAAPSADVEASMDRTNNALVFVDHGGDQKWTSA